VGGPKAQSERFTFTAYPDDPAISMTEETTTFLDRTMGRLVDVWRDIADGTRRALGEGLRPDLPDEDASRFRRRIAECLDGRGGEVSARARAADLGRSYLTLDPTGRVRFLRILATEFGVDRKAIDAAIEAVREAENDEARTAAEAALREALVPARVKLLTQFNGLPEGVKFLIDMRAETVAFSRDHPELRPLEADLKALLTAWFDIGFLELSRITWDSSASILEKLAAYEAVHEIQSWSDLKNRLDSDRRFFAFIHPRMPDEPLIFVEVALVVGMADNVQTLLDETAPAIDPGKADTAIFYSISNAQRGLAGISFGGFLIKRVVDALKAEYPNLKAFATLSPLPGFAQWFDGRLAELAEDPDRDDGPALSATEARALNRLAGSDNPYAGLAQLLADRWRESPETETAVRRPVLRFAAHYLMREKRGDRARDPVANFHLTNGARLERLNWMADTSHRGLQQSFGVMVNYLYKLPEIEENHEAYTDNGRIVASSQVKTLLRA